MRSKKAYRIKKASSQKHYYNALKLAAELDEERLLHKKGGKYISKTGAVLVSLALAAVAKMSIWSLWEKISIGPLKDFIWEKSQEIAELAAQGESTFEAEGDLAVASAKLRLEESQVKLMSLAATIYVFVMVHLAARIINTKRYSGLGWVDFIKNVLYKKKRKFHEMFNRVLAKPTPEAMALVKTTVRKDGSLDKSALKNYVENNLSETLN